MGKVNDIVSAVRFENISFRFNIASNWSTGCHIAFRAIRFNNKIVSAKNWPNEILNKFNDGNQPMHAYFSIKIGMIEAFKFQTCLETLKQELSYSKIKRKLSSICWLRRKNAEKLNNQQLSISFIIIMCSDGVA